MLELPNAGGEKIDGAACVDLPDSWLHVRSLLKFLYGFTTVVHEKCHHGTLDVVSGPLILATKYEMDDIRRQLVPVLERDWPSAYSDWMQVETELGERLTRTRARPIDERQSPAMAVQIGTQARIRSILPAAYYDLSRILLRPPPPANVDYYYQSRWVNSALLERDDLERLAVGRERIGYYVRQQLHPNVLQAATAPAHMEQLAFSCTAGGGTARVCTPILKYWWAARRQSASRWELVLQDPVREIEVLADGVLDLTKWSWGGDLTDACVSCRGGFARVLRSEAESLWKKLPEFFQLDSLPF
ncbi:hypothetical protein PsYK624_042950 [Phanerochaete sordida]|uniref:Uncharacterized protein n=1 Tax=Phanerochaete sordida TaxID=48140 RepID=A0A9P3LBV0_9APHY|nr:hypothetical protein PsYK624_042950 [Phanerochaete sordida]